MSITIVKPDTATQRLVVSGIIAATSKPVTLMYEDTLMLCPTCGGSDPFCPTCQGQKYVSESHELTVSGSVRWKSMERIKYRPEGQYVEGDCTVTLLHTGELENIIYRTSKVIVDDRTCVIDHWNLRGSPTNRIYLILLEDAAEQARV